MVVAVNPLSIARSTFGLTQKSPHIPIDNDHKYNFANMFMLNHFHVLFVLKFPNYLLNVAFFLVVESATKNISYKSVLYPNSLSTCNP